VNIQPRVTLAIDMHHFAGVPATPVQLGEIMVAADHFATEVRRILTTTAPLDRFVQVITELDYSQPSILTIEIRLNDQQDEPF
jgi:imidazoleglycerol phosphate dehydratase HisB